MRVRRWAWIIGSSFAALSGLLIAPSLPINALLLTLLVVQAFGAAAIGYFSNLPLTYAGGLAIGIAGALATKYVVDVPWLIGLPAGLPVHRALRRAPRDAAREARGAAVHPAADDPAELARTGPGARRLGRALRRVPVLRSRRWWARSSRCYSGALVLVILILSLGLLVRTSRQVSLCQYSFAAIGAAAMAHFTSDYGIPWLAALLLAGLVVVPVGADHRDPRDPALGRVPRARNAGLRHPARTDGVHAGLHVRPRCSDGLKAARPSFDLGPLHVGQRHRACTS